MSKAILKNINKSKTATANRSWVDLKNDKEQQKIYAENVNFIAELHTKYGCKQH